MKTTMNVCEAKLTYKTKLKPSERFVIASSASVHQYFLICFDKGTIEHHESVKLMLLNRANAVLGVVSIAEGGVDFADADIKLIAQAAILSNASGVILAHNHPSGALTPSESDLQLTTKVRDALRLFGITLFDHLIITTESYYSFADEGRI